MDILDVSTEDGDMTITEEDLPHLTRKLLKQNGIDMTPDELREAFATGQNLMRERNVKPGDRVLAADRPAASGPGKGGLPEKPAHRPRASLRRLLPTW
jgi:hypothetical protein